MNKKSRYFFKYIDNDGSVRYDHVDAYGENEAWELLKVFEPDIYYNSTVEMISREEYEESD